MRWYTNDAGAAVKGIDCLIILHTKSKRFSVYIRSTRVFGAPSEYAALVGTGRGIHHQLAPEVRDFGAYAISLLACWLDLTLSYFILS